MQYRILAIGDVVGEEGLRHLEKNLRAVQKLKGIHFTVVNGENASNVGLTPDQAWRIYDAGADAVTLGNHAFGKMQIRDTLEEAKWLLRPANFTGRMPGHGCEIFDMNGLRVRVVNLIGRCDLAWGRRIPLPPWISSSSGDRQRSRWWTSTPRPPAKSWPWPTIWTAV